MQTENGLLLNQAQADKSLDPLKVMKDGEKPVSKPLNSTKQKKQVQKCFSKSESYSSVKAALLSDEQWGKVLLDCLERNIISKQVSAFLANKFRWADRAKLFKTIVEEKKDLESIKKKVGPYQYLKYLDEVFTQILFMSKKEGTYLPKPMAIEEPAYDKLVVAMLIEDMYDHHSIP